MRKRAAMVLSTMLLAGCRDYGSPAGAYRNWGDRLAVATGLRAMGLVWPCKHKKHDQDIGDFYEGTPLDECYKMDQPRRWRGVWRNEFEGSRFCPAPAKKCSMSSPGEMIWLDVSKSPDQTLYEVDFIGRRTAVKGRYGHMGGFDHELIVDRMISMRQIEPPTKGYAKE